MDDPRTTQAARLMAAFAESTGLSSTRPPRRYLWTDAHAVCNFLALGARTGDTRYRELALTLVDQVHEVLGRHRPDAPQRGWLSGLDEAEARRHPTIAGLRIGKPLPERRPHERYDEALEWDRDGQYYHYLTKWMHALRQVAAATGEPRYVVWARELAQTALQRFQAASGPPRLYWKMSTDLRRPLLPASGQHDPLDGLVTALTLMSEQATDGDPAELASVTTQLGRLCRTDRLATDDPLGLGGLLFDASRLAQLPRAAASVDTAQLQAKLLDSAALGLNAYQHSHAWRLPAGARLAFRELGLSIGLHAIQAAGGSDRAVLRRVQAFAAHFELGARLEQFWADPDHRHDPAWTAHEDINAVMLATSLAPEGFVVLGRLPAA